MRHWGLLICALVVGLSGCAPEASPPVVDPSNPLAPYLTQEVDWDNCGAGGTLRHRLCPLGLEQSRGRG